MMLRELLGDGPDVAVTDLAFDNRDVTPGTLFFCVPGFTRDGHDFAPDAVAKGAVALVVERPLGLNVPELVVEDVRAAMARAAARFYGDPTARLKVIGVTGTNGKTTTAYLTRALLEATRRPCGLLGTVKSVVAGEESRTARTTPEAIDLQRTFRAMLDGGDVACAMEISSHALQLRRADAIHVAAAIFTNLNQDHLDFHETMEEYFQAKRLLFSSELTRRRIANADDAYGRRLIEEFPGTITFAIDSEADYRAADVRFDGSGSDFRAVTPDGEFAARVPLPGRFNVLNALGAWAAVRAIDAPVDAESLRTAAVAPGRFEPVEAGQPFSVVVDYAHKPDALEQVLRAARELTTGRLIVVFGAGGDRDRGKRPIMGEIAARLADVALITSDNPRSEPPEAIIDEIQAGIPEPAHADVRRDADRRASIFRAIGLAHPGDVVVIAGKGHEVGQELAGGRTEPFDDKLIAREAIEASASKGVA
jgi:UDP-N-acetylmuramoyl-L-alanyl-D-glutamate--2,6-diaminopimelate ligase